MARTVAQLRGHAVARWGDRVTAKLRNRATAIYNALVAQALLITTLLTIAGLIISIVMGFRASPAHHA